MAGDDNADSTPGTISNDFRGVAYIYELESSVWSKVATLTDDCFGHLPGTEDFGHSVDISGDYVIVGDPQHNGTLMGKTDGLGGAFIFDGSDDWSLVAYLIGDDSAECNHFGVDVSISGSLAIVGAEWASESTPRGGQGTSYLYHCNQDGGLICDRKSDNWGQVRKFISSDIDAGDQFGRSVAIEGSSVVVGTLGPETAYVWDSALCGDSDGDGDVDLTDYGQFQLCYSGSGTPYSTPSCATFDFDNDGDVDLVDNGAFSLAVIAQCD